MNTFMYPLAALLAAATPSAIAAVPCPADLNGNQAVDFDDLVTLLSHWGPCGACEADIDSNGIVDFNDLIIVLGDWGACPDDPGTGAFNYGEALQKAITFYDAQRAGDLPEDGRLTWRSDCFDAPLAQENGTYPVGAGIRNRYMDAGDTPTFVLPISFAMTTLAWSGIEFAGGWTASGQMDELHETLRWHADWCIAAHPQPNVFCGQIGQGGPSHAFWGAPEIHEIATGYAPKIWWLDPDHPGSEPAAEAAAFLTAASMVFDPVDPAYAALLLQHARDLYDFANTYRARYVDSIPDAVPFYNSWSGFWDELAWAATWLHRATGEAGYLDDARQHFNSASPDPNWAQSWDGKINGTALLLTSLTGEAQYRTAIEQHLDHWLPGGGITYTPGGLAWLSQWGSLRYAANTAFLAFAHASLNGDPDGAYRAFGEAQLNYMLGDNPRQSSYVCGFGANPPVQPHHRGAHGSWNNQITDPGPNRHVLLGALVGGPASPDDFDYVDVRDDYIANEVACDYNAGFTAALAHLAEVYGGAPIPDAEYPPAEDAYGREMFVEAAIIEEQPTFTRIRCLLNNRSAWPARWSDGLSFHIYINLTETIAAGYGPGDIVIEASMLDGATPGPLVLVNGATNLYRFEVSYVGESFGPGSGTSYRRESQIAIGLDGSAPSDAWDASNDPSLMNLPFGTANLVKTAMIPVYEDGVLIYGEEGTADCNDNGIDDAIEIADFGAPDLDGNGVPDECDPDCDGDGEPDAYEIAGGADDCDGNGVPDDCESIEDCDGDGIDDGCAIAAGDVADCDGNGVPDSCDIAEGALDADGDGVPDACQLEGMLFAYTITDEWPGGFTAELTIRNESGSAIDGWEVTWTSAYDVVNAWNAILVASGSGSTTVTNESFNPVIPDGGTVTIGFQGSGIPESPAAVTVNGSPAQPGG